MATGTAATGYTIPSTVGSVAEAQTLLNKYGANVTVDGVWGPQTQAAWDAAQAAKAAPVVTPTTTTIKPAVIAPTAQPTGTGLISAPVVAQATVDDSQVAAERLANPTGIVNQATQMPSQPVGATNANPTVSSTVPVATGGYNSTTDWAKMIIDELNKPIPNMAMVTTYGSYRDRKMAEDPTKYAGVTSTADLIAKYSKPVVDTTLKTITDVIPNPDGTYTLQYSDGTSATKGKATVAQQGNPQIDALLATLTNMATTGGVPSMPSIDYGQATVQAGNELNPQYDQILQKLLGETNIDLERRGIYSSALGGGIVAEKSGGVRAAQASDIGKRASEIQSASQANAVQQQQLYLQERGQRMDALSQLVNTLSNRELGEAELTGVLRGIQTIQGQQLASDTKYRDAQTKIAEAGVTGTYDGKATLEANKFLQDTTYQNAQLKFQEAQLTGVYKNNPTLAGRELVLAEYNTKLNAAISRLSAMGRVTTAEDAKTLGVPIGTTSFEARNAAANRANSWSIAQAQMANDNANSALDRSARAFLAAKSDAITLNQYDDTLRQQEFEKDLQIWELTGVAPDTAAMRAYGITKGTVWTAQTKAQADQIQAGIDQKEEQAFTKQVGMVQNYFGVDPATAEAAAMIFTNTDRASALAKLQAPSATNPKQTNIESLKAEGVDVNRLMTLINTRYPDSAKWSSPSTYDDVFQGTVQTPTGLQNVTTLSAPIKLWLDTATRAGIGNTPQAWQYLNDFATAFPGGSGTLVDKMAFIQSHPLVTAYPK